MIERVLSVIRAHRKPFVTFLIVAAILIAPPTRYLLVFHMSWMDVKKGEEPSFPFAIENQRKQPRNGIEALEIARRDAKSTKGKSLSEMIARYPNEPALYAALLRFHAASRDRALYYARPDDPLRPSSDEPLRRDLTEVAHSQQMLEAAQAVRMGRKLDPDNAFFDLMDAYLRYGERQDAEALEAVHRAASKHRFDSYARDSAYAFVRYGPRYPFPVDQLYPARKLLGPAMVEMGYVVRLRSVVGLTLAQSAEKDRIVPMMSDAIAIGGLMRDESRDLIDALTGMSIQGYAIRAADSVLSGRELPRMSKPGSEFEKTANLLAQIKEKAPAGALSDAEWRRIRSSLDRSVEFRRHTKAYGDANLGLSGYLNLAIIYGTTGRILMALWYGVLLWIPAAIWLLARRRWKAGALGPRPLWIIVPAVVLGLPARIFTADPHICYPAVEVWIRLAIGFCMTAPHIVMLAAVLRSRISPDVGRVDTIFARLRTGSAIAMKALLVVYALTVLVSIPVAVKANRQLDVQLANEPAVVRQMKP